MSQTTWNLDISHSEIQFKVKHMMISTVTGHFGQFSANVTTEDDDFTTANIQLNIDVDSINTKNEQRDQHLKSADFFDAAAHPSITFTGKSLEQKSGNDYILKGEFTIHGVTKPVALAVDFGGIIKDPYGMQRAGFEIEGKINRKDFGLNWSALTEAGGLVVSDGVKISGNLEFVKA